MVETNTIAVHFHDDERGWWYSPAGKYVRECDRNDLEYWDVDDLYVWDEVYDASRLNIPQDVDLTDLYDWSIVYEDGKSWLVVEPKD